MLGKLPAKQFVLDGELVIEGENGYSFSDLQLRLHRKYLCRGHGCLTFYFHFGSSCLGKTLSTLSPVMRLRTSSMPNWWARFSFARSRPVRQVVRAENSWQCRSCIIIAEEID